MRGWRALLAGLAAVGLWTASAEAADFYAGKTVTFYVGFTAGGSSDLACRMYAAYMGKHIAGNPTIIVKNMPGASSVIATNYVGKQARNDGLSAVCGAMSVDLQITHDPSLLVDLTKMEYVTGDAQTQAFYVRKDALPGGQGPMDVFAAKGLIYGGFALNSLKDVPARTMLRILGLNDYKYVTGFAGDGAGRAAIQQNFVNLWMEGMQGYAQVTVPTLVKSGLVVPLFQSGKLAADGSLTAREDMVPDLPTFVEFYKARYGKPPEGRDWKFLEALLDNWAVAFHGLMLAPGAPPAAVAAMRAAIGPLNADPEFDAKADALLGKGARAVDGAVVQQKVQDLLNLPPDILAVYSDTVTSGQAMVGGDKK